MRLSHQPGSPARSGFRLLAPAAITLLAGVILSQTVTAAPTDKEVDEALSTYHKAYASKDENDRLQAVEALGAVQSKRVVEALGSALTKDPIPAVRRAAAKALGGQWSLTAVPALARGLNLADDKSRDINTAIISALGDTNSDAAVPILTSILVPHHEVRQRSNTPAPSPNPDAPPDGSVYDSPALKSLAKIASPAAMNDVMDFLGKQGQGSGGRRGGNRNGNSDPISGEAERVLEAITGTKQQGILNWRKWWADNQPKVKVIQVERCLQSGDTWEKSATVTKCPTDGDKSSNCSVFLKSKLEGGGVAPAETDHKKNNKGNSNRGQNGGGSGGSNNGGGASGQ